MLPSAEDFKTSLLSLSPTTDSASGATAFAGKIGDFMGQIQAGSTGTPGILTFNASAMVAILSTMTPVKDNSWVPTFANAWEAGILGGVITPATVSNPAWIGSGTKDVATLPSAAASIPTLSVAKALLISGLSSITPTSDAPLPFTKAMRDAALALKFTCIGLGPPPSFVPIPILIPGI